MATSSPSCQPAPRARYKKEQQKEGNLAIKQHQNDGDDNDEDDEHQQQQLQEQAIAQDKPHDPTKSMAETKVDIEICCRKMLELLFLFDFVQMVLPISSRGERAQKLQPANQHYNRRQQHPVAYRDDIENQEEDPCSGTLGCSFKLTSHKSLIIVGLKRYNPIKDKPPPIPP